VKAAHADYVSHIAVRHFSLWARAEAGAGASAAARLSDQAINMINMGAEPGARVKRQGRGICENRCVNAHAGEGAIPTLHFIDAANKKLPAKRSRTKRRKTI
jgi:hypothetical protein